MRRALILSFLPVLGSLATTGRAQSILPYLPEGTVLVVSAPDLDKSISEFSQMPLAKMWREKEVQDFVQDAKDTVMQQYQKAMEQGKAMHQAGQLPVDPELITQLRIKGITGAITKLSIGAGDFGPMPEMGFVLQVDFGDTSKQWFELLHMGLGMLGQTGEMDREDLKIGDAEFLVMKPKNGPPGFTMGLNVAMVGNSLIVGTLRDDVRTTVENMQKGTAVLGATERYKANAKHLQVEGAATEMFLRLDPILDFAVQAADLASKQAPRMQWLDAEGLGRAIDALGLRAIRSVGETSRYVDGKAVMTGYRVEPAPDRKGLLAGANKNLDMAFLKWVPKDAVSFSAATLEPMSIYDALVGALNAYDPKIGEMAMGHLAEMEKKVGFSVRDDLFGAVGDSMVSWSKPMASFATPPEVAILIKVNDPDKIVKVLKSLSSMSDGKVELDEADKRGVKTYQFRVNFDPMRGMGGMNPLDVINPTFAFKDGYLVAGFSPSDIRQVFKRMERTEDDPKTDIRGNKEFAAYLTTLPKDVQSVSFTDWKAQFESFYTIAGSLLAFVPQSEDIPFDMSMLPDASTLTKHMFGSISYSIADGNGVLSTTVSPFGPEVALLFVAGIGAGAAVAGFMANVR